MGKDLNGNGRGLIQEQQMHLVGAVERKQRRNLNQDSRCPIRYSNREPPECRSRALSLEQPARLGVSASCLEYILRSFI